VGVGIWGLLGPGGLAAGALGDGFRCFLGWLCMDVSGRRAGWGGSRSVCGAALGLLEISNREM